MIDKVTLRSFQTSPCKGRRSMLANMPYLKAYETLFAEFGRTGPSFAIDLDRFAYAEGSCSLATFPQSSLDQLAGVIVRWKKHTGLNTYRLP